MIKPFAFAELVARIEALARRTNPASPPVLAVAGLEIDAPRHQALHGGRFLRLSNKKFAVLVVLARRAGIVVSAQDLLEKLGMNMLIHSPTPSE